MLSFPASLWPAKVIQFRALSLAGHRLRQLLPNEVRHTVEEKGELVPRNTFRGQLHDLAQLQDSMRQTERPHSKWECASRRRPAADECLCRGRLIIQMHFTAARLELHSRTPMSREGCATELMAGGLGSVPELVAMSW